MKTSILPKTPLGKRSGYLFILFLALTLAGSVISNAQGNLIEYPNPFNSPILGSVIYLTFLVVIIAFITALQAVRKSRERSLVIYIILLIGGWFTFAGAMLFIARLVELAGIGQ